MRAVHVARQAASLVRVVEEARRAYGAGRVTTIRHARALRRHQGFEYREALSAGALDPVLSEEERAGFVSSHDNTAWQRRLNGEDSPALVSDKAVFYLYCRALGLRVPEMLAIVHRDGDGWSRPDRILRTRGDWEAAATDLPVELVVKPAAGYAGQGVRVLERRGRALVDPTGRPVTVGDLWDELRADPEFQCFVVQERLRNHPELAAIGESDATLHTARIVTLVGRHGHVETLWAALKLGVAGTGVDNIAHGTAGNASCAVSVEDGRLGTALVAREDGFGMVRSDELTAAASRIRRVPSWHEALALVHDAARHFPPLRTLGWDVAITPDGPVIVEANAHWGMEQSPRMGLVLARMRAA
jgi:hypothetical protein